MLNLIAIEINDILKAAAFADMRFSGAAFYGLSETRFKDDKSEPVIVNQKGDAMAIEPNDTKPLIIYHKLYASSVRPSEQQYGRNNNLLVRSANMSMVIIAMRNKTKLSGEQLDMMLLAGMPEKLLPASLTSLNLKSTSINVIGTDFNSQALFNREWPAFVKPLSPDKILIEVKYVIGCVFDKTCINPLCC